MTQEPKDQHPVLTRIQRALDNLDHARRHAHTGETFEVTQLIASLQIVLMASWDQLLDKERLDISVDSEDVAKWGFPSVCWRWPEGTEYWIRRKHEDARMLGGLMRYVRNSFAHANYETLTSTELLVEDGRLKIPDGLAGDDIAGVRAWNIPPACNRNGDHLMPNWLGIFTTSDMDCFMRAVANLAKDESMWSRDANEKEAAQRASLD